MAISKEDWSALSTLLDEGLDIEPSGRAAWLNRQTHLSPPLLASLRQMLAQGAGDFALPTLPAYGPIGVDAQQVSDLTPGAVVGAYRLIKELGSGGMGTVWLAERDDHILKRQVALKLPHSALPQLAERFAREREILSSLVHPHIARLYDAGVAANGRPYLAIEYVDGQPIKDYCKDKRLGTHERIALFLQILSAVQYAHSQLVVHRDLKPGNVLVTEQGEVRLLDFGIAKLMGDASLGHTELTQAWGNVLTPSYAAPEQILGLPIGTAADIYALGVMLYELLTEHLPYRLARETRGAMEDAILHTDATLPSHMVAAHDKFLRSQLRGDLDAIVLKAIKKSPTDRYATVAAFADDLQRYLRGAPVLAQIDSRWYRAKKFVVRYRWSVVGVMVLILGLGAGLGVALWQANEARASERSAQAVSDFMQGIFLANSVQQGDPLKARQVTARELLDIAADKLEDSLKDAPQAKMKMLLMFSELYSQLGLEERSMAFADQHAVLASSLTGADSETSIEAQLMLISTLRAVNPDHPRLAQALDAVQASLDRRKEFQGERRAIHAVMAAEYLIDRDLAKAVALANQAVPLIRTTTATDVSMTALKAARINYLAGNCTDARSFAQESITSAKALDARGELGAGGKTVYGAAYETLALAEFCLGNAEQVLPNLEQALQASQTNFGEDDPETIRIRARLADYFFRAGNPSAGIAMLDEAQRRMQNQSPASTSRLYQDALAAVAHAQVSAGRAESALSNTRKLLALRPGLDASPTLAAVWRDQVRSLLILKRSAQATEALERAIAMRKKSGLNAPWVIQEELALEKLVAP